MKKNVVIIGAGLVGSLLSIYLVKRGYNVKIYERRSDMREAKLIAGRSINLALSDRGIRALKEIGIIQEVEKIAIPMHGRSIHNIDGTLSYQAYGEEGQFINSVSRGELNKKLMTLAEEKSVEIIFNHACENIDWDKNIITFKNETGHSTVQADLIFGSDGAFSAARLSYQLKHDRFQYQQHYIDFGYKELTIPAGANGAFQMEKNALHIWPRGNYMLIALPNIDGSFTCTLFFPYEGEPSFASLKSKDDVMNFFEKTFADTVPLIPTLADDFFNNPTASLVTVKCFPWVNEDKFALIGDAAHALVPFFGQGMNCGFEDCFVLNELLDKHNDEWTAVLQEYQLLRKPDGDAIAQLALNNFVEMRDKVGDPIFLLQKKIENLFSKKHPDKWIPAYSMVTFSPDIRYSEALSRGNMQQNIMDKIMADEDIENNWDSELTEQKILTLLASR